MEHTTVLLVLVVLVEVVVVVVVVVVVLDDIVHHNIHIHTCILYLDFNNLTLNLVLDQLQNKRVVCPPKSRM